MNAGLIQTLTGSVPQATMQGEYIQVIDGMKNTGFGSLLSNITASQKQVVVSPEDSEADADVELDNAIVNIFNATTVEELIDGLQIAGLAIPELQEVKEVDDFNQSTDVEISNLIDKVMPLLEQAGLSESEILAASASPNLLSLLTIVDEIGPKLFSEIGNSLEGKSVIPKEQAIELLTVLKSVTIIAPETDLTMKQEQQLFSLQEFIVAAEEGFERTLHTNQSKNNVMNLMNARQVIRFIMPNEVSEEDLESGSKETPNVSIKQPIMNALSAMRANIPLVAAELETKVNADQAKDTPKENLKQSVMSALSAMRSNTPLIAGELASEPSHGQLKEIPKETMQQPIPTALSAIKTEAAPAELESRNNARNETLLREMQAIFKRSNFGHTGGTNRLLIKLNPEHLGQVRIELMQTNGVMTARILASSALGKEMLDSQLHQLRSAFLQQNLQVDRIDISQTLEDSAKNQHKHGMFNQHFKHQQEEPKEDSKENKEEEITFQEYLIELEA